VLRKLLLQVHLYLALGAGVFITLLGLTGSVLAFEPEIDHLLHWNYYHLTAASARLSLADLSGIVKDMFPNDAITAYQVSDSPGVAWQVDLAKSGAVFLNPYSGEVLGISSPDPDFLNYVHTIHVHLAPAQIGRKSGEAILKWSSVAFFFIALSGLYLWWPVKRFRIRPRATGSRWWLDLHYVGGIFSLLFLVVLSGTGMMLGFEKTVDPLFYKITGSQPLRYSPPEQPASGAKPISADHALAIARAAIPEASPFSVEVPEATEGFLVRMRFPEDRTPGGRTRIVIDQFSGKVLFAENSRTAPAGRRIGTLVRAIHTGDVFGIPSKFLMSLASLMAVVQTFSGILVFWKRSRKARQTEAVARKPAIA
jgi:uncharacterized iron-regulated membrane protein